MVTVPLSALPSQSFQIVLDDQDCEIDLLLRGDFFYLNLTVNGEVVQQGAIVMEGVSIIQMPNNFFKGSLAVFDTLGEEQPSWEGLGDRWQMVYFSATDPQPTNGNPALGE